MRNRVPLLLAMAALTVNCGGHTDGDPTGPNEGTLEVLASTTGPDPDADGYTVSVDSGEPHLLPSNGADTVASLSPGTHTVALAGVASNCVLAGQNPRTIEINASSMTSLPFDIACNQAPAIRVSAATTGEELDPNGYQVAVDGGSTQLLSINGSLQMGDLTPGEHEVALLDVADNCVVAGNNPVRVASVNGSTTDVDFTVSCSPVPLAPPGHDIAFRRDGEVYLLSADGTSSTNLTDSPGHDDAPAWSPDGQTIAFSSDRSGSTQIHLINADGSGQTQLTSDGGHYPAWSPDGTWIAFSANEQIYLMNPDGSSITQLTTSGGSTPSWSPDGTRITFMGGGSFETDIFLINVEGSDVTQLTTAPGIDANPDWSPDGTKIAFNSDRSGGRHIHVMNPDGTGVTQLTFGNHSDVAPAWSPDGSKIAFSSSNTETTRLYMVNPDGTEQVPLTPDSYGAARPAWRP
jgi:dipeptidyl aminopeptidase/acylaminoacyl peptidase